MTLSGMGLSLADRFLWTTRDDIERPRLNSISLDGCKVSFRIVVTQVFVSSVGGGWSVVGA